MRTSTYVLFLCSLLGGCCALECVATLTPIKPYLDLWDKSGMTIEMKGLDSVSCGGARSGPGFGQAEALVAQRIGETEVEAIKRLGTQWDSCMVNKGYRYLGRLIKQ